MMITSLLNLKHCHFKSHDTCALCDHSKPRAFLSFLNVFECCYRTRHQAFLLRTKREVSSDKRVQKCKHQLDSIRRLIKNGRNRYACGVSSVAQQRGMAYSAERIGSEQYALDSKKRRTEKDDLQRKTKRMKKPQTKAGGLVQRRVTMATRNPKREKQQTISTRGSMKVHAACMTEQGTITVRRL